MSARRVRLSLCAAHWKTTTPSPVSTTSTSNPNVLAVVLGHSATMMLQSTQEVSGPYMYIFYVELLNYI